MWSSPRRFLCAPGVTGYKSEINLHCATGPTLSGGAPQLLGGEQKNRRTEEGGGKQERGTKVESGGKDGERGVRKS